MGGRWLEKVTRFCKNVAPQRLVTISRLTEALALPCLIGKQSLPSLVRARDVSFFFTDLRREHYFDNRKRFFFFFLALFSKPQLYRHERKQKIEMRSRFTI